MADNQLPVEPLNFTDYSEQNNTDWQSPENKERGILNVVTGMDGKPRFKFWPERLVISGATLFGDVASGKYDIKPEEQGKITEGDVARADAANKEIFERVQDMAGLAGGGTFAIKPGTASVGSGLTRNIKLAPVEHDPFIAKPFYSALEETVNANKQDKMPAEQWAGTIKNSKGVKPEEIEATGLNKFLEERKGTPVTKEELQQHLADNKVEFKEKILSRTDEAINKGKELAESHGNNWDELSLADRNRYIRKADGRGITDYGGDPQYEKYVLPGGENYREVLMSLPQAELKGEKAKEFDRLIAEGRGDLAARLTKDLPEGYKSSHWEGEPNVLVHTRLNDRVMNDEGFVIRNTASGNKSQPFATRAEAEAYQAALPKNLKTEIVPAEVPKKSLHIEEIQSDWHQQGRKRGYKGEALTPNEEEELSKLLKPSINPNSIYNAKPVRDVLKNSGNDLESVAIHLKNDAEAFYHLKRANPKLFQEHPDDWAHVVTQDLFAPRTLNANEATRLKQLQAKELAYNEGVPDAPFKKNWHELALKRSIREAAEKGYDRVSWTPGEAQAARYDLSKHIESLRTYKNDDGTFTIYGKRQGGREYENMGSNIAPEKLEDHVGKEVAQKIIDKNKATKPFEPITKLPEEYGLIHDSNGKAKGQEWGILPRGQSHAGSFTGRYHKTEEEAVQAALDKINSEARHIYENENRTLSNLDLKVGGEGMKGFYDKIIPKTVENLLKEHGVKVKKGDLATSNKKYGVKLIDGKYNVVDYEGNPKWIYSTESAAKTKADEMSSGIGAKSQPVFYFDIPQSLKDQALKKGFPLFSAPMFVPVDHDPFGDNKRLTPVDHQPEF